VRPFGNWNLLKDEEYTRRVLEGDQSIYLPQPNRKFEPTWYDERVAHALGYQQLQDKFKRGELKHWVPGCDSNDCSKSGPLAILGMMNTQ
jgi:hypothetical protein